MSHVPKDPSKISDAFVKQATAAGPSRGLRGSEAGTIARLIDPDFTPFAYGVGTVKSFIAQFAEQLKIIRYSGLDPIFGLAEWPTVPAAGPVAAPRIGPTTPAAWRVWASPRTHLSLGIRRDTGQVRVLPTAVETVAGEVKIRAATLEQHQNLARDFLRKQDLDAGLKTTLAGIVGGADPTWWRRWNQVVKTNSAELHRLWLEHRHLGLESALRTTLRSEGIEGAALDRALYEITARAKSVTEAEQAQGPGTSAASPEAPPVMPRSSDASSLRTLVLHVLARMNDEELRSLLLPLGPVVDAVAATLAQRSR
jgi:hypothetical protein